MSTVCGHDPRITPTLNVRRLRLTLKGVVRGLRIVSRPSTRGHNSRIRHGRERHEGPWRGRAESFPFRFVYGIFDPGYYLISYGRGIVQPCQVRRRTLRRRAAARRISCHFIIIPAARVSEPSQETHHPGTYASAPLLRRLLPESIEGAKLIIDDFRVRFVRVDP